VREFDDEPGTGGGYEHTHNRLLDASDGIRRRIVFRFHGRPVNRVSIILEELRDGIVGSLMRYDDSHGFFHRHIPGWPEPSKEHAERFDDVEPRMRAAFADEDIEKRYTAWEVDVFGLMRGDELP